MKGMNSVREAAWWLRHTTGTWKAMLVWILLAATFSVDGLRIENRTQLAYGRDLVIPLSRRAAVLYFSPLDTQFAPVAVWNVQDPGASQWRTGRSDGRRWMLEGVTYEDQGKYTQHDITNHILSSVILTVREERQYLDRHVNGSMSIPLRVPLADVGLSFRPEGMEENFSLVRLGKLDTTDSTYQDRLQLGLTRIVLEELNLQDSGQYELRDRHLNLVSSTRLRVSDSEDTSGNPYLGLLALLGVGGGIFCCVRKKKCCKKKSPHIQGEAQSPDQPNGEGQVFYHPTPNDPSNANWTDPSGPPPNWTDPAGPPPNWAGPGGPPQNWTGPAGPPPNWAGPGGPPQNWTGPAGPPPNWAGPAGPPQNWVGPQQPYYGPNPPSVPSMYPPPSPGPQPQWNPGYQTAGYTPVMYSAPPTASEPVKEDQKEATTPDTQTAANTEDSDGTQKPPSSPLPVSSDCLHSSAQGIQFQIDKGDRTKDSSTHNPLGSGTSETANFL
ncbi:wu:fc21g02 isoform X2 [Conger conger]|uniref:wu:fc21g02 isoform X2 n=1 Tax=Conger conger TaxID=82655 RepID=UPI002A5A9D57|nr:wu:fc21g02 isoform X2 [Conger conger]